MPENIWAGLCGPPLWAAFCGAAAASAAEADSALRELAQERELRHKAERAQALEEACGEVAQTSPKIVAAETVALGTCRRRWQLLKWRSFVKLGGAVAPEPVIKAERRAEKAKRRLRV